MSAVVGVYDASGSLLGEAAYLWGRWRGTRHCGLCDITHSPLRRKPAWDRVVAQLEVPVELLHLDELPPAVEQAVTEHGAPVVLARTEQGYRPLVLRPELDDLDGSVEGLASVLRERLAELG